MPENHEASVIWEEIKTQVIAGGMGIVGIQYKEFRQACRDLDIYRSRGLTNKIKALEKEYLACLNKTS